MDLYPNLFNVHTVTVLQVEARGIKLFFSILLVQEFQEACLVDGFTDIHVVHIRTQ